MKTTSKLVVSLAASVLLVTPALAKRKAPTADAIAQVPKDPPKAMPAPVAAPETLAYIKAVKGTWRCSGTGTDPTGTSMSMSATITHKAEFGGMWLLSTFQEKKKNGYKFVSYAGFDSVAKKWTRVIVDNMGGVENDSAAMPTVTGEGKTLVHKFEWEGKSVSPMGTGYMKHHEEIGVREAKLSGEFSMDNKTWMKAYDMQCKK